LSKTADTLVILMGMKNLQHLVDRLLESGKPPLTPVAVITEGTTRRQRTVTGMLRDIVARVKSENLKPLRSW